MKRRHFLGVLAALAAAGCVRQSEVHEHAAVYRLHVHGRAMDANGAPVASVTVTVNGYASVTNASGYWAVWPACEAGKTYFIQVTPPAGWRVVSGASGFQCPPEGTALPGIDLFLAREATPTLMPTVTPTPVPSATATPTPSPTDKLPPGTPTPALGTVTPTPTPLATGVFEVVGFLRNVGEIGQFRADFILVRGGSDTTGLDSMRAGLGGRTWLPLITTR